MKPTATNDDTEAEKARAERKKRKRDHHKGGRGDETKRTKPASETDGDNPTKKKEKKKDKRKRGRDEDITEQSSAAVSGGGGDVEDENVAEQKLPCHRSPISSPLLENPTAVNGKNRAVEKHDHPSSDTKESRKYRKKEKKAKKEKKTKKDKKRGEHELSSDHDDDSSRRHQDERSIKRYQEEEKKALLSGTKDGGRVVASSAIEFYDPSVKAKVKSTGRQVSGDGEAGSAAVTSTVPLPAAQKHHHNLTLLLFYQYVEPVWDESTYDYMLTTLQKVGTDLKLTGRMRVAREGLNCTLTGRHESILEYCQTLRNLRPKEFESTEFKLTTDLPVAQRFPNLKVFKVVELVHYGLEGSKAPPISEYHGTHLEPTDYHRKLAEPNTVIIDVRNHYEAAIGRFVPPQEGGETSTQGLPPPKWLDPKMRKSTEFPAYLDRPETREEMKGKQVLMYCTGGIRCERASALLKYKMETDPEIKALGIQGVFQLQGGIDKYFKEFPDGGYWKGKNYVFDKRFAHAPPKIDGELHGRIGETAQENQLSSEEKMTGAGKVAPAASAPVMGKCEACCKPWDMYRGKRRCPTCGVPSLICKDCFLADKEGRKKLGRDVRCDLCVEQGIFAKRDLKERDEREIRQYEAKMAARGLLQPNKKWAAPNPAGVTRLFLKNMCRKSMNESALMEALPGITHIVWRSDRKSGDFLGSGWVEMAGPADAANAVAQDGKLRIFGRPLSIAYQAPDGKDAWPPKSSAVGGRH